MKITHSHSVASRGRTQSALCGECGRRATLVTFEVGESIGRGTGAKSVAKRLRSGKLRPKLEETDETEALSP